MPLGPNMPLERSHAFLEYLGLVAILSDVLCAQESGAGIAWCPPGQNPLDTADFSADFVCIFARRRNTGSRNTKASKKNLRKICINICTPKSAHQDFEHKKSVQKRAQKSAQNPRTKIRAKICTNICAQISALKSVWIFCLSGRRQPENKESALHLHKIPIPNPPLRSLVAQCSATPATVAATPPCSATPFQIQISVRHLWGRGGEVRHQNF